VAWIEVSGSASSRKPTWDSPPLLSASTGGWESALRGESGEADAGQPGQIHRSAVDEHAVDRPRAQQDVADEDEEQRPDDQEERAVQSETEHRSDGDEQRQEQDVHGWQGQVDQLALEGGFSDHHALMLRT
jgi:hypothetical protein